MWVLGCSICPRLVPSWQCQPSQCPHSCTVLLWVFLFAFCSLPVSCLISWLQFCPVGGGFLCVLCIYSLSYLNNLLPLVFVVILLPCLVCLLLPAVPPPVARLYLLSQYPRVPCQSLCGVVVSMPVSVHKLPASSVHSLDFAQCGFCEKRICSQLVELFQL